MPVGVDRSRYTRKLWLHSEPNTYALPPSVIVAAEHSWPSTCLDVAPRLAVTLCRPLMSYPSVASRGYVTTLDTTNDATTGTLQPVLKNPGVFQGYASGAHPTRPSPRHTTRSGTHTLPLLVARAFRHSNSHWSVLSFHRITSPASGSHARHSSGAIAVSACDVLPSPHTPPTPLGPIHDPAAFCMAPFCLPFLSTHCEPFQLASSGWHSHRQLASSPTDRPSVTHAARSGFSDGLHGSQLIEPPDPYFL